ncbi:cytochrome c biogenesis heme-transporting ATPase CcmA [Rhizobacter sp. J219]|jgi:heme exporter protein A|uniref:cytochrome c biogenesis heme-transporting ATPase CcmA n=1 Tax=Rhizobacter sp. J219 TaxID=2898430 RepID=UPI0021516BE8|nr:cytochrome c biogenesis heme-transporting ATPase CcmA [Rhizobacter sp. J219]MCR5883454.1 cytochrome c biogenesis heme-transporting ATPase CcmA [Rhizobacter sp. J219]
MTTSAPAATPDHTAPLLAAVGLACRRGDRVLFKGLDLAVRPGEVVWLRGANGRGKTSLLRLLAGLSTPEAGEVKRAGALLYVAHANALKEDLTVLESLRFLARLHGREVDDAALTEALRRFGMATRRHAPVRTLSQGQRRRVALSRLAMVTSPTVWVLDEPFDALDVDGIATLNDVITRHVQGGGAVVLTSHQALTLSQPLPNVLQLDEVAA